MLGKRVPDFSLPSTGRSPSHGTFSLSAHRGAELVLYFYPKDNTPGCTAEGADFRDLHGEFRRAGARVFGISRDSLAAHERFKEKMRFPFELLSVREESPRHRAQHLRHSRRRGARARMARGQGPRSCPGGIELC